jgi:hypothetical protein
VGIPRLPTGRAQQLVCPRLHLSEEPLPLHVVLMDFQFFQQGHEELWWRLCYLVFNPEPGANVPANTVELWETCSGIHGGYSPYCRVTPRGRRSVLSTASVRVSERYATRRRRAYAPRNTYSTLRRFCWGSAFRDV